MLKIGYVGLGVMGGSLARHLVAAYELTVYDRNPEAVAAMVACGAHRASSAEALARHCDIIILCLPRSSDVEAAMLSADGVIHGLSAGKIVIDQTSGVPEITAALARKTAEKGAFMLDAPLSGGIPAAQNGTVTIIVSGPDAAWQVAEPVLGSMSGKIYRCSERVGDAQALKLVNNAIGAGYRISGLELTALGCKLGLDLKEIVDRLNTGPGASFPSRTMLQGLVEGRATTNFSMALMLKDLNELIALDKSGLAPLVMTIGARSFMQATYNLFGEGSRLEDVVASTEKLSAVKLVIDGGNEIPASAVSLVPAELLSAIETVALLCNLIAICECVAVGRNFGLKLSEMDRILNKGSAWSAAGERLLPALALGEVPALGITVGETLRAAALLKAGAASAHVPLLLPHAAMARLQAQAEDLGGTSDLGEFARLLTR